MVILEVFVILLAGFAALAGLHIVNQEHDLRPLSIPIITTCMFHLVVMLVRYIFMDGDPGFILADLLIFFMMLVIGVLMLTYKVLFRPIRSFINNALQPHKDAAEFDMWERR